jgi:hypothetical protein
MGFAAVNAFVCSAERTQIALYLADKPKYRSLLFFPGMLADRAVHTDLRHKTITACNFTVLVHNFFSF